MEVRVTCFGVCNDVQWEKWRQQIHLLQYICRKWMLQLAITAIVPSKITFGILWVRWLVTAISIIKKARNFQSCSTISVQTPTAVRVPNYNTARGSLCNVCAHHTFQATEKLHKLEKYLRPKKGFHCSKESK